MNEGIFALFVLLFFGIVCASIANAKGRSAALWFLWGVLFNAFALLLIANLPRQEK